MRTLRARPAVAALAVTGLLAACTSSSHPAHRTSSPPDAATDAATVAANQLATRVAAALAAIRTVHVAFTNTGSAGGTTTGRADVRVGPGTTGASHFSEALPTGDELEVITVGGVTYARMPAQLYRSRKPWVRMSEASSSAVIRTLAATIAANAPTAALDTLGPLIRAATVVRSAPVPGGSATRYTLTVATTRLPAAFPGRDTLRGAGIATLDVTVDVDPSGRPLRLTESAATATMTTTTTIALSRFDQAVTIVAPPPAQVGSA